MDMFIGARRMFELRTWRIFETFQVFKDLSHDEKCTLFISNYSKVAAIVNTDLLHCCGGSAQIQQICGEMSFKSFIDR